MTLQARAASQLGMPPTTAQSSGSLPLNSVLGRGSPLVQYHNNVLGASALGTLPAAAPGLRQASHQGVLCSAVRACQVPQASARLVPFPHLQTSPPVIPFPLHTVSPRLPLVHSPLRTFSMYPLIVPFRLQGLGAQYRGTLKHPRRSPL
jgi:hypothetical protein